MSLAEPTVNLGEHSAAVSLGVEVLASVSDSGLDIGNGVYGGGECRVGTSVGGGPPINFVRM